MWERISLTGDYWIDDGGVSVLCPPGTDPDDFVDARLFDDMALSF